MLSIRTPCITSSEDESRFMPTWLSHRICNNILNMWMQMEKCTLIAEKQPFKGWKITSLTLSCIYKVERQLCHHKRSIGNEVDTESGVITAKDRFKAIVITLKKLEIKDIDNDVDEWMINENLAFTYLFGVAIDYMPLATSTDVDGFSNFEVLTPIHIPIRSSMVPISDIDNADGIVFKVPARQADQNPIIFVRVWSRVAPSDDSET